MKDGLGRDAVPDDLDNLSAALDEALDSARPFTLRGRVTEVLGTMIRADLPEARIGEVCRLVSPRDVAERFAEVVGFSRDSALLTPFGRIDGVSSSMEVVPTGAFHRVPAGDGLLGRVLDGLGRPLDAEEKGPLPASEFRSVTAEPPHPLRRSPISKPMPLGVRVLDGLLTCGEGQRLGIFAAAGGGKSTLLASMVRGAQADVKVVALIGERGREVREFIEAQLGPEGLAGAVLVVATSDRPAVERLKAAYAATAIAESFRDRGRKVLLVMDSLTRFARAQREIGLAAGEPPTRRGFPPSVFSSLPVLIERAGPGERGSITGIYTVLVEGDDPSEPVADEVRSLLDGHVVLSRKLAAANHYPAVDILSSVSRMMGTLADPGHLRDASRMRELYAKHSEIELLVRLGEYRRGADAMADAALDRIEAMRRFLRQDPGEKAGFASTLRALAEAVA